MRVRFAPSPTGPLHIGHAYSALLMHDMVRAAGGTFLLRFEDTDLERSKAEYVDGIIEDLSWLGITWDAPPLYQSAHLARYNAAVDALSARDLTYPCNCSRKSIAAAAAAPQEGAPHPAYPQTCKARQMEDRGPNDAIRLHMDRALACLDAPVSFVEEGARYHGVHRLSHSALRNTTGDIVVGRKDIDTAAYFLASALDDIEQEITHVVRGEDLFDFTPVQVLLLHLFGYEPPIYHHHKLIRDEAGKRLAKRDDARAISTYRQEGLSPADIARLVGLG